MPSIVLVPWYRITIRNIRGEFEAFGLFSSRAACVEWYKGYMFGLNPKNNESDFYPYSIEEVYDEI